MRSRAFLLIALLWAASAVALQPAPEREIVLQTANGTPVQWHDWAHDNGPAAVLLWASWTPKADQILQLAPQIERTARERRLAFVVISVQEEYEAARKALDGRLRWLHDRHGQLLRELRVLQVPSLVIVGPGGQIIDRLEASPSALERWQDH